MAKAIFLDRDGTIIKDVGYLHKISDIEFLPNALLGLKNMQNLGYKLVIITNQSGVARGYYTEVEVQEINNYLQFFLKLKGINLAGIYYCPHHPTAGKGKYLKECNCRKPKIGLLEKASQELNLEFSNSWMIGDKKNDILAGIKAKCRTILVLTGEGKKEINKITPNEIAKDLLEASKIIAQYNKN